MVRVPAAEAKRREAIMSRAERGGVRGERNGRRIGFILAEMTSSPGARAPGTQLYPLASMGLRCRFQSSPRACENTVTAIIYLRSYVLKISTHLRFSMSAGLSPPKEARKPNLGGKGELTTRTISATRSRSWSNWE